MALRRLLAVGFGIALLLAPPVETKGVHFQEKHEPGVRLRLFRLGERVDRPRELEPDQSPNLDRTIERLELKGDEPFLEDQQPPCVAVLTARLQAPTAGRYPFRVAGDAPVTLAIDGEPVALTQHTGQGRVGVAELTAEQHEIEVRVFANLRPPKLSVHWNPPGTSGFRSVPPNALSAEAFYFRPTNSGIKRLVADHTRPGLGRKVAGLYPGLDAATLHPPDVRVPVGGLALLRDGTLVVAEFDAQKLRWPKPQPEPNGALWLFHKPDGDPAKIRRKKIADGLFEPVGTCVVGDAIYVSQRNEVTRFDRDATSGAWVATTVASGWETTDFHALSFGLLHEPGQGGHPGYLYLAKGTGLGLKQNPPNHGAVWRIDLAKPAGQNVHAISGGHRTPNGLAWGPVGTLLVTDNQGEFTPANELNVVREGAFYGFFHETHAGAEPSPFQPDSRDSPAVTEAAVWLPQDEISNSPTEPLLIPDGWPFAGQVLVGDMRYGGVIRVSMDRVNGAWQGAAYRFTQGCEGGVNRLALGDDGSLYVGGIGGDQTPTWAWVNPEGRRTDQGLQRFRPNGRTVFDIERVRPTPGGFAIRFTKPVDTDWLSDPANYQLQQWTYEATPDYGGPKKHVEKLRVVSAAADADHRGATLAVEGLRRDRVVHFVIDPEPADGETIWSAEAWYTLREFSRE